MATARWVEVSPSQFAHEAEGLRIVRELLPDAPPFRAWSNLEFRDGHGNWAEVDLLVLAPDGLHLVELKYYSGRLGGDDITWRRGGHRAEDSPLRLANTKAKRLKSKLMAAYDDWVREKRVQGAPRASAVIPYVSASVFLHHPDLVIELPESSRIGLYGLPGSHHLVPIDELFQGAPRQAGPPNERILVELMNRIGLRARKREAGSFVLDSQPYADGPGWQDWLATHKLLSTQRQRIRFRVLPEGSSEETRRRAHLVAAHELQVMQRLNHDAVLRPVDFVDSELGPGLVYPFDPTWQRLDLWLANRPTGFDFDAQVALLRSVAEAIQYAHGKNVVHRRLNPRALLVRTASDGRLEVRLTDWQGVGRTDTVTSTQLRGATVVADAEAADLGLADESDVYTAPEIAMGGAANRLSVDVYGLGVLAFYLVTDGRAPAANRSELVDRLRDQHGLDVSVELPSAPPALRESILQATAPRVSDRFNDVSAFLAALDAAAGPAPDAVVDPLDAQPGALLGGRFTLQRRLGGGSTAVGLLVQDAAQPPSSRPVVLKMARDDASARRLTDEAAALAKLASARIVKLLEGPLDIDGRRCLVLEQAGAETLGTHLGNRERLSLDLLERWGSDLLESLATLDKAGIMHRDVKPSNLGVREERSNNQNRSKHLVLFDFSLTRAPASDVQAGTPPYLDPFLGATRPYDSAAERYAAAVVLFEMATGHTPVYGDGLSDPDAIDDEATVDPAEFDQSAKDRLVPFFTRALARDASARQHTADDMLQEWRACFPSSSVPAKDADTLADQATADTPLDRSGLTPRALSALEQLKLGTVGDLAQVDAVRLNRLPGLAAATRDEIRGRAKSWRARFRKKGSWRPIDTSTPFGDPYQAVELLLGAARTDRAGSDRAVALASQLLGVTGTLDANASQAELAAGLRPPVTRARVSQLLGTLQERWAQGEAVALLDRITDQVAKRLTELGGVATFPELTDHLFTLMVARPELVSGNEARLVEGLLRCAIDRRTALERAEGDQGDGGSGWVLRRREGRPLLVGAGQELLDLAESLSRRADALVAEVNLTGSSEVVLATRVFEQLAAVVAEAAEAAPERDWQSLPGLRDGRRLARLAARLSQRVAASATGELHDRDLPAATALRLTLAAVSPGQTHTVDEVRERVRVRFPEVAKLPKRPELDAVMRESGLPLRWDETAYRSPDPSGGQTTGLTRTPTFIPVTDPGVGPGAVGQRLLDSRQRHSFVALGVTPAKHDRLVELLQTRFGATTVDLTHALLDALHATAAAVNLPWSTVLAADASADASRDRQGLQALVQRSLPTLSATLEAALAGPGDAPVALTDASLLARYDALGVLTTWLDLATPRARAVWLVVPQLYASTGAMVDGRALPLTAPNQFVPVPDDWIETQRLAAEGSHA